MTATVDKPSDMVRAADILFDLVHEGLAVSGRTVARVAGNKVGYLKLEGWLESRGYFRMVEKLDVWYLKKGGSHVGRNTN